jgi:uncharacterized protein YbjT (DUF2867 family)
LLDVRAVLIAGTRFQRGLGGEVVTEKKSVAVFGGSGKTGRELIAVALERGLRVRALYRPGSEPADKREDLDVITGQLTNPEDIRRTLEGTMGAILVFGPRLGKRNHPMPFTADATARIVAEMKQLGVPRLIVQVGAMAGGDTPNWSRGVRWFVGRYRKSYPEIDSDRDAQEVVTKESGLDWTLVKPFRISGARGKGNPRVAPAIRIGMFTSIRRRDLVEFHVNELLDGRFHRQAVYIVS